MKRGAVERAAPAEADRSVRVDKWLWAARFFRTRGLAAQAIEAGHVRVDGARVKPAHPVRPAARVTVRKNDLTFDVDVLEAGARRGSASEAAKLYRETSESAAAREKALRERKAARAQATPGRPTKRDRRKLEDFLNEP
jgi:ribosome-associated heat shock protein Hsp15